MSTRTEKMRRQLQLNLAKKNRPQVVEQTYDSTESAVASTTTATTTATASISKAVAVTNNSIIVNSNHNKTASLPSPVTTSYTANAMHSTTATNSDLSSLIERSKQNDAKAQLELAICYEKGLKGAKKDNQLAFNEYRKLAVKGDPLAQYKIGAFLFYYEAYGLNEDDDNAFRYIKLASAKSNKAKELLARCYEEGRGVDVHIEEAILIYKSFSLNQDLSSETFFRIAFYYHRGYKNIVPRDLAKARAYYEKALEVDPNHFTAKMSYARCLIESAKDKEESEKGFTILETHINEMHVPNILATILAKGTDPFLKPDLPKALEILNRAAVRGDFHAAEELGMIYCSGKYSIPIDHKKAHEHFVQAERLATEKDGKLFAETYLYLSKNFAKGEVAPQDLSRSKNLLEKAAKLGNPDAQYELGLYYKETLGLSSEVSAYSHFAAASNKNHQQATIEFVHFLLDGIPGLKNLQQAREMASYILANDSTKVSNSNNYDEIKQAVDLILARCKMLNAIDKKTYTDIPKTIDSLVAIKDCNHPAALISAADSKKQNENEVNERMQAQRDLAACYLAEIYQKGIGVLADQYKACELIRHRENSNNGIALRLMGNLWEKGLSNNYQTNMEQAKAFYEKASAKGDVSAALRLAYFYLYGLGTAKDVNKAYQLFIIADSHALSEANTGLDLCKLQGVGDSNRKINLDALAQQAQDGNKNIALILSKLYLKTDLVLAIRYYKLSAPLFDVELAKELLERQDAEIAALKQKNNEREAAFKLIHLHFESIHTNAMAVQIQSEKRFDAMQETFSQQLKQKDRDLKVANAQITEQEKSIDTLEQEKKEAEELASSIQQKYNAIQEKTQEIEKLSAELNIFNKKNTRQQKHIDNLNTTITNLRKEITAKNSQIQKATMQSTELGNDKEAAEKLAKKRGGEIAKLNNDISNLTTRITELTTQKTTLENNLRSQEEYNKKLTSDLKIAAEGKAKFSEEIAGLRQQVETFKQQGKEMSQLITVKESLQQRTGELAKELITTQRKLTEAEGLIAKQKAEIEALRNKFVVFRNQDIGTNGTKGSANVATMNGDHVAQNATHNGSAPILNHPTTAQYSMYNGGMLHQFAQYQTPHYLQPQIVQMPSGQQFLYYPSLNPNLNQHPHNSAVTNGTAASLASADAVATATNVTPAALSLADTVATGASSSSQNPAK